MIMLSILFSFSFSIQRYFRYKWLKIGVGRPAPVN
nr:MAG TPA: hypothetical protein [Caudoviricetes sp.]